MKVGNAIVTAKNIVIATGSSVTPLPGVEVDNGKGVIVDSTVSEKAIAYPTDNRLLEIARYQLVKAANAVGIKFKQTYAAEGKMLRNKAAGYAHAKQTRRLTRTLKRQRTILGIVIRETQRKLEKLQPTASSPLDKLIKGNKTKRSSMPCTPQKPNALVKAKRDSATSLVLKQGL